MEKLSCPICENVIEIETPTKPGDRVTCVNCFAQLALFKYKNKLVLACAICKEPVFDPGNCGNCERRREQKKLYEEGRL